MHDFLYFLFSLVAPLVIIIWFIDDVRLRWRLRDAQFSATLGRQFRHVKRGATYQVVATAKLQTSAPVQEDVLLVIYRGDDGIVWARPKSEFFDGRFEPL